MIAFYQKTMWEYLLGCYPPQVSCQDDRVILQSASLIRETIELSPGYLYKFRVIPPKNGDGSLVYLYQPVCQKFYGFYLRKCQVWLVESNLSEHLIGKLRKLQWHLQKYSHNQAPTTSSPFWCDDPKWDQYVQWKQAATYHDYLRFCQINQVTPSNFHQWKLSYTEEDYYRWYHYGHWKWQYYHRQIKAILDCQRFSGFLVATLQRPPELAFKIDEQLRLAYFMNGRLVYSDCLQDGAIYFGLGLVELRKGRLYFPEKPTASLTIKSVDPPDVEESTYSIDSTSTFDSWVYQMAEESSLESCEIEANINVP